ncbi:PAAR domain-containing protein [Limnobaculum zhutongyuii]|uniref:PAAR domain-containing protein n=1 Tax=Limnobaculum zhutongyuii TaxID=2498113 RepID=A0A411WLL0_9GAMM|nr:PAAR domain-containing protein [Limnobaculum zhutongyuii]QBH97048.1 PAAR domain-containing protein [Limnobaculum zhutongyuii]TQS87402.1 PAAR domain-containing protein [Limnobaculum zhutongyuii]
MRGIVCLGDATDHGGRVITASSSLYFEGKVVALVGDLVSCPVDGHGVNPIIEGDNTLLDNGRAVVTHFCLTACGCHVLSNAPYNSSEG